MASLTLTAEAFKAGLAAAGVEATADFIFNFTAGITAESLKRAEKAEAALKECTATAAALQEAQEALKEEKKRATRAGLESFKARGKAAEWEARANLSEAEARSLKEENTILKMMLDCKDDSLWKALGLSITKGRQLLGITDAGKGAPTREELQQVTFDVYRHLYGEALKAKGIASD
jgi:hypothetical protein